MVNHTLNHATFRGNYHVQEIPSLVTTSATASLAKGNALGQVGTPSRQPKHQSATTARPPILCYPATPASPR
jgi:hypothetical protein